MDIKKFYEMCKNLNSHTLSPILKISVLWTLPIISRMKESFENPRFPIHATPSPWYLQNFSRLKSSIELRQGRIKTLTLFWWIRDVWNLRNRLLYLLITLLCMEYLIHTSNLVYYIEDVVSSTNDLQLLTGDRVKEWTLELWLMTTNNNSRFPLD